MVHWLKAPIYLLVITLFIYSALWGVVLSRIPFHKACGGCAYLLHSEHKVAQTLRLGCCKDTACCLGAISCPYVYRFLKQWCACLLQLSLNKPSQELQWRERNCEDRKQKAYSNLRNPWWKTSGMNSKPTDLPLKEKGNLWYVSVTESDIQLFLNIKLKHRHASLMSLPLQKRC